MTIDGRNPSWNASFHADSEGAVMKDMRDAFLALRRDQAHSSLASCAKVDPDLTRRAIASGIDEVLVGLPGGEDNLYVDPVFTTWTLFLNRAIGRRSDDEVRFHCAKLESVMERVKARLTGQEKHYVSQTRIAVQQTDIDPYIMAVTPPSYDFQATLGSEKGMNGYGHPLPLQVELVNLAFANIAAVWPELRSQIEDVVQILGYLPDASFRSCSALRYSGVIYLGNMDERILDIEESIVHEAGHQVLYRVGELSPLVEEGTPKTDDYTLPWSGSKRDLFGFLHAYYIYTLLTKYFWRRAKLNEKERKDCIWRTAFILSGSVKATDMLLQDRNLSPQGRKIVEVLGAEVEALKSEVEPVWKEMSKRHA